MTFNIFDKIFGGSNDDVEVAKETWNDKLMRWSISKLNGHDFWEGAKVKVKKSSGVSYQINRIAKVIDTVNHSDSQESFAVNIKFDDEPNIPYFYKIKDLELANPLSKKELKDKTLSDEHISDVAKMFDFDASDFENYISGEVTDLSRLSRDKRKNLYDVTSMDIFGLEYESTPFGGRDLKRAPSAAEWNYKFSDWIISNLRPPQISRGSAVMMNPDKFIPEDYGLGYVETHFGDCGKINGEDAARVIFEDGSFSTYRKSDLILADSFSNKDAGVGINESNIDEVEEMFDFDRGDLEDYITGMINDMSSIPRAKIKNLYNVTGMTIFKPEFKLPVFNGKYLDIKGRACKVNFLGGDFGEVVLDEYNERKDEKYNSESALRILSMQDGVVEGGNVFSGVLINEILRDSGFRTATPSDLEMILDQNVLGLGSSYNHVAVVLKTQCGDDSDITQYLSKQIKQRDGEIKYPVTIPLASLGLDNIDSDESKSSAYGLTFKLRKDGEIFHTPQFAYKNHEKGIGSNEDGEIVIINNNNSGRVLYISQFGISPFRVDYDKGISILGGLKYSSSEGRTIIVEDKYKSSNGGNE